MCGNNKANADEVIGSQVGNYADEVSIAENVDVDVDKYYNVNETRGEFEFRIQNYPIPIGKLYSIGYTRSEIDFSLCNTYSLFNLIYTLHLTIYSSFFSFFIYFSIYLKRNNDV